jgi:hypothetical protein
MDVYQENMLQGLILFTFMKACVDILRGYCGQKSPDTLSYDPPTNIYDPAVLTEIMNVKEELNKIRQDISELINKRQETPQSEQDDVVQYQIIPPNRIVESSLIESVPVEAVNTVNTVDTVVADVQQEDKHSALRRLLKNESAVYCSYKGTDFQGSFHIKPTSPHGYVIRDSQNFEYDTPTHFSFTKKRLVNPNIHSDNGWDSVYIHNGANKKGNPKKMSLKALVDPL